MLRYCTRMSWMARAKSGLRRWVSCIIPSSQWMQCIQHRRWSRLSYAKEEDVGRSFVLWEKWPSTFSSFTFEWSHLNAFSARIAAAPATATELRHVALNAQPILIFPFGWLWFHLFKNSNTDHMLDPKLIFVTGLVIFVSAVVRVVCPELLG